MERILQTGLCTVEITSDSLEEADRRSHNQDEMIPSEREKTGMEISGLVTVIIPVYNVKPYLVEALESVVKQTYENLEILVIDDGSDDGSQGICDEYQSKDPRVRVVHQERRGLSAARNAGLDLAAGEFVVFLDSDDAYYLNCVETMVAAMSRSTADLVVCKVTLLDSGTPTAQRTRPRIEPGKYDRVHCLKALIDGTLNHSVWNKLYRKRLWETIRFPEGRVFEEIDTAYQIIDLCDRIVVLEDPLYRYRIRPGSISHTLSPSNLEDWLLAWSHFEAFVRNHIPDVFTEGEFRKLRRSVFSGMVRMFVHYSNADSGSRDPRTLAALRGNILETAQNIALSSCPGKIRMAYRLIRYCPWLLKTVYPLYRRMRRAKRQGVSPSE